MFKEKVVILYSCIECKLENIEKTVMLSLLKDNTKNLTSCKACNKPVEYSRINKLEFI